MEDYFKGILARGEKHRLETDFDKIEERKLSRISDKELAAWQAKYPPDSPQWILSTFEWQRWK